MLKLLVALVLVPAISGCSALKSARDSANNWAARNAESSASVFEPRKLREDKRYLEEGKRRVVYTPLVSGRSPADPGKFEFLLRSPSVKYKEIGFISIYREYANESAADLLPFVRERAIQEGAEAVLLMEMQEKPIGVSSRGAAVPIGDVVFANSYTTFDKEGTIRGVAIVYGE